MQNNIKNSENISINLRISIFSYCDQHVVDLRVTLQCSRARILSSQSWPRFYCVKLTSVLNAAGA